MKAVEHLIVTFTCNNHVHVYHEKSGVLPMPPFKSHSSIEVPFLEIRIAISKEAH